MANLREAIDLFLTSSQVMTSYLVQIVQEDQAFLARFPRRDIRPYVRGNEGGMPAERTLCARNRVHCADVGPLADPRAFPHQARHGLCDPSGAEWGKRSLYREMLAAAARLA